MRSMKMRCARLGKMRSMRLGRMSSMSMVRMRPTSPDTADGDESELYEGSDE